jgi:hypothetical protein
VFGRWKPIRATSRITGIARNTIDKLFVELGCVSTTANSPRITMRRCNAMSGHSATPKKESSAEKQGVFGYGDIWTFVESTPKPSWFFRGWLVIVMRAAQMNSC